MPKCTYCGGTDFFSGPEGGMSVNILCANDQCRHWFNYTPAIKELDDLHRVEPTKEEAEAKQAQQRADADTAREARFEEGRKAFRDGAPFHTLRIDEPYGNYAEPEANVDRLCGYIDAMGNDLKARTEKIDIILKRMEGTLNDLESVLKKFNEEWKVKDYEEGLNVQS